MYRSLLDVVFGSSPNVSFVIFPAGRAEPLPLSSELGDPGLESVGER